MEYLSTIPWWVFLIVGVVIIYFIILFVFMGKKKKAFKDEHPEAAIIQVKNTVSGIKTIEVSILKVDGDYCKNCYMEGKGYAYYLMPGKHTIEVRAITRRPGVLYKNVNTTYGPRDLEVELKAEGKYKLGFDFDIKNEKFTFEENQ